ncbi:hypothetical protein [Thermoanaerobacterium sp. DL9XJH110]|uniref:hypothetical protein n=1 Tax=Thermoanaerobacterium sp. DL9XJH110 TaxID=3386643 RepID=UPI003BB76D48
MRYWKENDYKHLFKQDKIVMSHVSVKPGERVPPHVHDNEEQTYWIISGKGYAAPLKN